MSGVDRAGEEPLRDSTPAWCAFSISALFIVKSPNVIMVVTPAAFMPRDHRRRRASDTVGRRRWIRRRVRSRR